MNHFREIAGLLSLAAAFSFSAGAEPAYAGRLRIVELKGAPYERGYQHGRALRPEITALLKLWKADLKKRFGSDPDAFIRSFFATTNYRLSIQQWTPELVDEIKGIAAGASINFETMFVYQLVDEYWVRAKIDGEHCSSIGIVAKQDRPTMIGQNLDLEYFRDGFQTVLRIDDENDLKSFVVTFPVFIGAARVNTRGVAVVPNTLDQLKSCNDGLPVACVIRGILWRTNLNEATSFLKSSTAKDRTFCCTPTTR